MRLSAPLNSTAEVERLCNQHRLAALRAANKFIAQMDAEIVQRIGKDEICSEALYTLWRCMRRYDPAKSKPTTYIYDAVWKNLGKYVIHCLRRGPLAFSQLSEDVDYDPAAPAQEPLYEADEIAKLRRALTHLPPRQQEYGELLLRGLGVGEISAQMDLSKSQVSNRRCLLIHQLRERFGISDPEWEAQMEGNRKRQRTYASKRRSYHSTCQHCGRVALRMPRDLCCLCYNVLEIRCQYPVERKEAAS